MSTKELARLAVTKGALDGAYTVRQAAKKPGISPRRVKHLKKAVREQGDGGVIHGNAGRPPGNAVGKAIKKKIIALKETEKYRKANFTDFRERLLEYEGIEVSYTCLRAILNGAGIVSPKTRRSMGARHNRRERRATFGELIQTDASLFDRPGIGTRYALHGFRDDATGDIPGLYICESECLQGYLEAFRAVLIGHGVPEALYTDRIGVYFVNTRKPENRTIEEQLAGKTLDKTQFGRIAEKPGRRPIAAGSLIAAGSPRAKGRIERLRETLQSRLTQFFQFRGIKTLRNANAALPRFIKEFNRKSRCRPLRADKTSFAPIPPDIGMDTLLAAKFERKTGNAGCFSFHNYTFQIDCPKPLVKKQILFLFSEKIGFKAYYNKTYYAVKFSDFLNKDKHSRLPQVTKRLIRDCYFSSVKSSVKKPENKSGG